MSTLNQQARPAPSALRRLLARLRGVLGMSNGRDPWEEFGGASQLDEHIRRLRERLGQGLGFGSPRSGGGMALPPMRAIGLGGALLALLYGMGGFFTLDEQERAVVLRLGNFHRVAGPGLNWRPLLVDSVYPENVSRVRQHSHESEMLTMDENIVSAPVTVQYDILDIRKFVLNVENPERSLRDVTESALRHVVGHSRMDGVLSTNRFAIALDVQERIQQYMDLYETGLRVVAVNLLKGNPPRPVQDAFVDVVKAAEDKERLRNEAQAYANRILPEARGEAMRKINEGRAYRDSKINAATGEASRFEALRAEYAKAPQVTRRRLYLEAVEEVLGNTSKVLVAVQNGNNLLYLPLPQMAAASAAAAGAGAAGSTKLDEAVSRALQNMELPVPTSRARRR